MRQGRVCNLRIVQIQLDQRRQPGQVMRPGIADLGGFKTQFAQLREGAQLLQICVCDCGACKRQRPVGGGTEEVCSYFWPSRLLNVVDSCSRTGSPQSVNTTARHARVAKVDVSQLLQALQPAGSSVADPRAIKVEFFQTMKAS